VSAQTEDDTALVDELATLQDNYRGDLEIELWGVEAISRKLRDRGPLVQAVISEDWARAYCGYVARPPTPGLPDPFGLVEDPLDVLGLSTLRDQAEKTKSTDPATAIATLGEIALKLDDKGFPAHARIARRQQAEVAESSGDSATAYSIWFQLSLDRVIAGETLAPSQTHDVQTHLAGSNPLETAKGIALACVVVWYERGLNLDQLVPALRTVASASDPDSAVLTCLALEEAITDGLYDFDPPLLIFGQLDDNTRPHLSELREIAKSCEVSDLLLRARLRCAIADISLTASSSLEEVDTAFKDLVDDAAAGRLQRARGLVTSRAAYAFATRGYADRSENLWRQSILASSEEELYGDVRNASRAISLLSRDDGEFAFRPHDVAASALPNRSRAFVGSHDPLLASLESLRDTQLANALGDARRFQLESRVAGHLQEEILALNLIGDILRSARHGIESVQTYVKAGQGTKAAELAGTLVDPVDVSHWLNSPMRRRRAAAVQVLGAQHALVDDDRVASDMGQLLDYARGLWGVSVAGPSPERDAIKAIGAFAPRIPETVVGDILAVAAPGLEVRSFATEDLARLLALTYWAVPSCRDVVAASIATMLKAGTSATLWGFVQRMPAEASSALQPVVTELAGADNSQAIEALAGWRIGGDAVQLAARRACAALLRQSVGVVKHQVDVGTREHATVQLLLALLAAAQETQFDVELFRPELCHLPGGTLMTITVSGPSFPAGSAATSVPSWPDEAAEHASGDRVSLARAVAMHLTAVAEDDQDSAESRTQAVHALRYLLPHLERGPASEVADRLATVAGEPRFSEFDQYNLHPTSPLSRTQFNSDAQYLGGLCLVAASEAFELSKAEGAILDDREVAFVESAHASAVSLLRNASETARAHGALILVALSRLSGHKGLAMQLISHPDPDVRALGAQAADLSIELVGVLAEDPSPTVRAVIACRVDLREELRAKLRSDPNADVRAAAQRSDA
jgi:hypothetical protein